MKIEQLYPHDVALTYEGVGEPPLMQQLVCRVYLPAGNLLLYQNSVWRQHVVLSAISRLNEKGKELYQDDTFLRKQYLQAEVKEKELRTLCSDFVKKTDIVLSDAEQLISAAEEYIAPYQYFDTWFTDGAYELRENPSVAAALRFAEASKNVLREGFSAVFFVPGECFLNAVDHLADCLSISRSDLSWYSLGEIEQAFNGNLLTPEQLAERRLAYVYYRDLSGQEHRLFGNQALEYIKAFDAQSDGEDIAFVKGKTAHGGAAIIRGNARIIKSDYTDFSKTEQVMAEMTEGDILLSPTTAPDLMPAFRKAAAVVTDSGGMLSHAAITARELDIPCIVGTRIATKVFKDGDLLEVDVANAIVRKITI